MNPLHDSLLRRLRERWKSYRRELKACRREFSEASVHESRVAARQLLATLELLASLGKTATQRRACRVLKRHLDLLSPLRDAQVQSQLSAHLRAAWPAQDNYQKFLRRQAKRAARRAENGVSQLKTHRLAKGVARFDRQLRRQDSASAPADFQTLLTSAARCFARARVAKAGLDAARPETIHRLRVTFKKFRYTVELLGPFLPELPADYLPALRSYQGEMGDIQDLTVLLANAAEFAEHEQLPPAKTRAMLREIERRRKRLIRRYLRHTGRLDTFWPLPLGRARSDNTAKNLKIEIRNPKASQKPKAKNSRPPSPAGTSPP